MIKNRDTLRKAIINTAKNRETLNYIDNASKYIELISEIVVPVGI